MQIEKVAVIGSGTMGRSIACHIASSGVKVLLLDMISATPSRNFLVESALNYIQKKRLYTDESDLELITLGNLKDDLPKLQTVDLVIEAIIEDENTKHDLYKTLLPHLKKNTILASNTSTIPLATLIANLPQEIAQNFLIMHFFNPPRYMELLELVTHGKNSREVVEVVTKFCELKLGKTVVNCNDTPGFIANRVGFFWLVITIIEAYRFKIDIEDADSLMSNRHIGVPKTGVFALLDLIGLDVFLLIIKSLTAKLPANDLLSIMASNLPKIIDSMVADGYTGLKGHGGFYRKYEVSGGHTKQVIDLHTGLFRALKTRPISCFYTKNLKSLFSGDDESSKFAWSVWSQTLCYTASIVPEISDDIRSVDKAMKLGYNWKYGPFELVDKLHCCDTENQSWFVKKLIESDIEVPKLLTFNKNMYSSNGRLTVSGQYEIEKSSLDLWCLEDLKKIQKKPILENISASLWDVGDGVACFEFTSKANVLTLQTFKLLNDSINLLSKDFKGLIIGNDRKNFCSGGDLLYFKNKSHLLSEVEYFIAYGQETFTQLKFSNFPVVSAACGYAVGGGCEVLLHSDAIQAHIETYAGLVEMNVGLVPGWGGCCEMILRYLAKDLPLINLFKDLIYARVSKSAKELRKMNILRANDGITMNRGRLLADAKAKVLALSVNYQPSQSVAVNITAADQQFNIEFEKLKGYDRVVAEKFMAILTDIDISSEKDIMNLEKKYFMQLFTNSQTLSRIANIIEFGKKLDN